MESSINLNGLIIRVYKAKDMRFFLEKKIIRFYPQNIRYFLDIDEGTVHYLIEQLKRGREAFISYNNLSYTVYFTQYTEPNIEIVKLVYAVMYRDYANNDIDFTKHIFILDKKKYLKTLESLL